MMTQKDYAIIIGCKEMDIYDRDMQIAQLKKDLEAARAQLEELARDRNSPV
jgi:hypothetical protein